MQEAKSLNYTKTVFYQNIKGSANFLFYFVPYKLYLICVALKGRGKKVFESIYHGLRTLQIVTGGGGVGGVYFFESYRTWSEIGRAHV